MLSERFESRYSSFGPTPVGTLERARHASHRQRSRRDRAWSGFGARERVLSSLFLLAAVTLAPGTAAAQLNQILLDAVESTNATGDFLVEVDISIDFSDFTVGGGASIDYDASRLEFVSFQFDPAGPTHFLDGPADGDPSQPLEFAGGWFIVQPPFGVDGLQPFGTATFRGIADGDAVISVSNGTPMHGPFTGTNGAALTIQDASVTVTVSTTSPPMVPVFGNVWSLVTLVALLIFVAYSFELRASESS